MNHHEPLSDANAAAQVILAIVAYHKLGDVVDVVDVVEELGYRFGEMAGESYKRFSNYVRTRRPGSHLKLSDITAETEDFDEEHPLFGHTVVFTGTLESMSRRQAAQKAVNVGVAVQGTISKKVDYLVMGETNLEKVGSDGMSGELRRAVKLAESGEPLEIIGEHDFVMLVDSRT